MHAYLLSEHLTTTLINEHRQSLIDSYHQRRRRRRT